MSAIGAVAGGVGTSQSGFSGLSSDDFMKIVLAELAQQDPLEPSDTGALLDQLASIRAIQADVDLERSLRSLVSQNELASATGFIGRVVSGVSETNERSTDIVISVSITGDGPVLNLANGQRVRIGQVDEVVSEELFRAPTGDE